MREEKNFFVSFCEGERKILFVVNYKQLSLGEWKKIRNTKDS